MTKNQDSAVSTMAKTPEAFSKMKIADTFFIFDEVTECV